MKSSGNDHEFLDREEWESWGALMMLHRTVVQALDTELRRQHGLAVTEFDVLITLYNAPGQRLGMSALADRVLLSPAGTTHLVTRLERDGMVRREVDPTDRRKWFTVLTSEGDRTPERSPTHPQRRPPPHPPERDVGKRSPDLATCLAPARQAASRSRAEHLSRHQRRADTRRRQRAKRALAAEQRPVGEGSASDEPTLGGDSEQSERSEPSKRRRRVWDLNPR